MSSRIIAMDTETDRGKAVLITKPWSFCEPHSWEECIEYLSRDKQMACWNSDYDGQAVMKWLPAPVRNRVALLGQAVYGSYHIKYVKKKFFRIWYERVNQESTLIPLFTVYDMRQFYNCSLAKAADKLGVQRKKDIPKIWYSQIAAILADPKRRQKLIEYALGDAMTLQQIIDRTAEAFEEAGLKFERPFSNASFSERYFRERFRYRRNKDVEEWARAAYHGGRIECLRTGFFKYAWLYDINSAYPSIIAHLIKPNGRWMYEREPYEIREDAIYAYVDCKFDIPQTEHVGPIPIKSRAGVIRYPVGKFRKKVTLSEYRFADKRGWVSKIFAAWVHIWPKYERPFGEIAELYKQRKTDPRREYALKIVMNAVYGKMAQTITRRERVHYVNGQTEIFDGRVWKKKEHIRKHTSFVYASEITSKIRMQMLTAANPKDVIFYSTDGIMTSKRIANFKHGSGLGEWGKPKRVRNLVIVGSGVYSYEIWEEKEWKPVIRFRGFSPSIDLPKMLKRAGNRHWITMRVLRNTSLRQAIDKPAKLNVLEPVARDLNVNFDIKRAWPKRWGARELTERQFKSKPLIYYRSIKLPLRVKGE